MGSEETQGSWRRGKKEEEKGGREEEERLFQYDPVLLFKPL